MRKTILLLVSVFAVTLSPFAHTRHAFAQNHDHDQQYPPGQSAQQPAGPTLEGLKAKNFTVRTLDGKSVSLNTLLGEGKPVLMDFWATWCGPCRMVIPHMGEMHRRYGKDGLIVIGMNLEEPGAQGQAVRNFVKRSRMDYQNIFAPHAIYQFFSGNAVARIPFTLLFGPDGKIIWRLVGYSPQMSVALNGAVERALAAAAEKPAEPAPPEKQTEQVAPEKPVEQPMPEKPVEQPMPEKPVEQPMPEKPVEKAPEKPVEQSAPEKPVEQPTPEKPVEQPTPEKPAAPPAPEKQTEQSPPEKSVEQSATPATKNCCNCPCCSSRAEEKKTEQGAPDKPAQQ